MLLDPSEEQFDLPALLVKQGDHLRGQGLIVGDEDELLAGLRIAVSDSPDRIGVEFAAAVGAQADELIAIPHTAQVESLNAGVAGSIVLYEAARQRRGQ